jgi:hypothetical protein
VQISRTFKSEGITYPVRIQMVFGVMLELFGKCSLGSLSMFKFVHKTGGRGHEVSKVGVEGIIDKGD